LLIWLLAAVAGGFAAWLTLAYGTVALTLAVLILVWSAAGEARAEKIAGVLVGAGLTLLMTLALAASRCMSAQWSGFECRAPDLSGLVSLRLPAGRMMEA
jgi:hypothetical protein